jgi:type I restriction enzyme S subunit
MNKDALKRNFLSLLDILRIDALTGEKALRNMSYLLTLKLLEPQFGPDKIDIDNTEHYANLVANESPEIVQRLLRATRFSTLTQEREENLANILRHVWDYVLSEHPATRNIFLSNKKFEVKHHSTFKKLVDKAQSIDLSNCDFDVLGNAYEEVIKDIMTGKVLGQFFTQPSVKRMMVEMIGPKVFSDGTFETCCDPTMGTGGFLLTYYKYICTKAKQQGITLDKNFLTTRGLFGKEVDEDTFQLACSNMLISSGLLFRRLFNGDSLRDPIGQKFDCILANPPYGLKGLSYDDIRSPIKNEYVPIKSTHAVSLFLQAIICMLKVKGRCAVVLPDGQELFTKTNKTLMILREYLLRTCDLKEIVYLPPKIFDYTPVKTCVFYFEKKKEGADVLHVGSKQTYTFAGDFSTETVSFYNSSLSEPDGNLEKTLLGTLTMSQIQENGFSLNFTEYVQNEERKRKAMEVSTNQTKFLPLKDICDFKNGKALKKDDIVEGPYPVVGGGFKPMGHHNAFNTNENTILCSSSGSSAGYISKYPSKVWASDCFSLSPNKMIEVNNNYLFLFLKQNQDIIYAMQTGLAQQHVYARDLSKMLVPLPSLQKQEEIVRNVYALTETFAKYQQNIDAKMEDMQSFNKILIGDARFANNAEVKKLGDLCSSIPTGKSISSGERVDGEYRFFTCSSEWKTHNAFFFEGNHIIQGSRGTIKESVFFTENKERYAVGTSMFISEVKDKSKCLTKYIYYYLKVNTDMVQKIIKGLAIPMISKVDYYDLDILLPSLEAQQEIVDACEKSFARIQELEKEKLDLINIQNRLLKNLFDFSFDSKMKEKEEKEKEKEQSSRELEGRIEIVGAAEPTFEETENIVFESSASASASAATEGDEPQQKKARKVIVKREKKIGKAAEMLFEN